MFYYVLQISSSDPDAGFLKDLKVCVKLTGDGTNTGKRLHVVNFGFTILHEGDKAYSAVGNHCLAIFKEPESYDSLKKCLSDISEVEQLKSIEMNGMTFEIDYYLGGDLKFLALATGIDSASSTYACIWCKCPASECHISSQKINGQCLIRSLVLEPFKRTLAVQLTFQDQIQCFSPATFPEYSTYACGCG